MARRRDYDDDDGRTVADMGDVSRPGLFAPGGTGRRTRRELQRPPDGGGQPDRPWETGDALTGQERRWYALGALGAALLIALVFILGLGIAIAVMLALWA